ncbi:hypothetical protein MBLNU457_7275t1 [Dothideomycetes sp. NU457]
MASLRGMRQADLSKKLYALIKTQNHSIGAYEAAAKEQTHIASQLSDWGEETGDDAISDLSDKLGVLLAEIAEQEDGFASNLEESRTILKQIRNTESSVQPSRDHKAKISDEIQKLKYKEPSSTKIPQLEQELVRAEAQSLVAEAQLTNITRQKFKEAYDVHTAAIIERAEKQIMLAKHARHLLEMLDDTPVVPGDTHEPFAHGEAARDVLNQAEDELRNWEPSVAPIESRAGNLGTNAVPGQMAQESHHHHQQQEQTYARETPVQTQSYEQEAPVRTQSYEQEAPVQTQTHSHVPESVTSYDEQPQAYNQTSVGEPTPFVSISSEQMEAEQQRQIEAENEERTHYSTA